MAWSPPLAAPTLARIHQHPTGPRQQRSPIFTIFHPLISSPHSNQHPVIAGDRTPHSPAHRSPPSFALGLGKHPWSSSFLAAVPSRPAAPPANHGNPDNHSEPPTSSTTSVKLLMCSDLPLPASSMAIVPHFPPCMVSSFFHSLFLYLRWCVCVFVLNVCKYVQYKCVYLY